MSSDPPISVTLNREAYKAAQNAYENDEYAESGRLKAAISAYLSTSCAHSTPDTSLIEKLEALWNDPLEFDQQGYASCMLKACIEIARQHRTPDLDTMIREMKGLKEGIYWVDGKPNMSISTKYVNATVDKCIAILKAHYGIDGEKK
jgi:hypothetical protein